VNFKKRAYKKRKDPDPTPREPASSRAGRCGHSGHAGTRARARASAAAPSHHSAQKLCEWAPPTYERLERALGHWARACPHLTKIAKRHTVDLAQQVPYNQPIPPWRTAPQLAMAPNPACMQPGPDKGFSLSVSPLVGTVSVCKGG